MNLQVLGVLGSTPVAVLPAAILLSTALHVWGGKVKGDDMDTETTGGSPPSDPQGSPGAPVGRGSGTKTTSASMRTTRRKWIGQSLIVLGSVAGSMTAAVASSAHWQGPRRDGAALRICARLVGPG